MVKEVSLSDVKTFKRKALYWASSFNTACVFDANNFDDQYSAFDWMLAAGVEYELKTTSDTSFTYLKSFKKQHPNKWLPGFLSYDLKNEIENLTSENVDYLRFPNLYFFVPKHVILIKNDQIEIISETAALIFEQIYQTEIPPFQEKSELKIQSRFSKEEYLDRVNQIRQHIIRGNIYETNFCQEFFAENVEINPTEIFDELNTLSPTPFACWFKMQDHYILSASLERFLAKRTTKLISQPIKGTAARSTSPAQDEQQKNSLKNSIKEKAENVIIVDLVRNDLTKSAVAASVKAEELFGIYSFQHVHQMVSSISAELKNEIDVVDAIKNTFPAGSMTGAPKLKAMQLMEQFEVSKRSIYAGSVGYFSPDNDFDFNVVIRTILYNAASKYLSFQVGSAITFQSDPEAEYQECLLKAKAILQVLNANLS